MLYARIPRPLFAAALVAGTLLGAAATPAAAQSYTFTTLAVPGAGATVANGINDAGQVVGYNFSANFTSSEGFLYGGGAYQFLSAPGAVTTVASAISSNGIIVGYSQGAGSTTSSFLYRGGAFQTLTVPGGSPTTNANGVNAAGQVVIDALGVGSVLYDAGTYRTIAVPGGAGTVASGINDAGQIVGNYTNSAGDFAGFVYDGSTYRTIAPLGYRTFFHGISSTGILVGSYFESPAQAGDFHGFVYENGRYHTVDVPGATLTQVLGVNSAGQLVGYYTTTAGGPRAFVATPVATAVPEPGSLALAAAGLGLVGAGAAGRRARRG